MSDWILKWNNIDGDCFGEEYFTNKEDLKEKLEELKDEYSHDELEWDIKKGKKCPCCNEIVDSKKKLNNLAVEELEYNIKLQKKNLANATQDFLEQEGVQAGYQLVIQELESRLCVLRKGEN